MRAPGSRLTVVVAAGAVVALLGRDRLAALPDVVRRRRGGLPRGVEEFRPTLVDRRHLDGEAPTAPPHADTAVEVVGEYYEEHPGS